MDSVSRCELDRVTVLHFVSASITHVAAAYIEYDNVYVIFRRLNVFA